MRFLILFLFLFISGCATLSESECIHGDWFEIGQTDGRNGYKSSRVEKHSKACQKTNTNVDFDAYMQGRKDGLKYYCSPQNGFDSGLEGSYYNKVCPIELEREFLEYYSYGKEIYIVNNEISSVENEMDQKERELEDDDTTDEERRYLRKDIKYLIKDLRRLNRELINLEQRYNDLL